jgi:hypothetical protein
VEYCLGDDTGISHYFVDTQVQNGRTYYYAIVAYDYGAPEIGDGISPTENNITIELDEAEEILRTGKNVAVVVPGQTAAGFKDPGVQADMTDTYGNATVDPVIFDRNLIKAGHTYKVKFSVDTLGSVIRSRTNLHPMDLVRVNNGLKVYDVTDGNRLVYEETPESYPFKNIIERDDKNTPLLEGQNEVIKTYYYAPSELITDSFDGIQLKLKGMNGYFPPEHSIPATNGGINTGTSGWLVGSGNMTVKESKFQYYGFPYTYDIVFTDDDSAYVGVVPRKLGVVNLDNAETDLLLHQAFPFYVINRQSVDENGEFERVDLMVEDLNGNGEYDILEDRVLVGHASLISTNFGEIVNWGGTVFGIDFLNAGDESELPAPGSIYRYDFLRPFSTTDSITFTVEGAVEVEEKALNSTMDEIKVVPNPYVMTNMMEPAVANKFLNQRRRILFTHIPAQCTIKIFTPSGVLVDQIDVDNEPSDGTVHWDLLTREDLEIAAGMYIYHVKSHRTGKEKIGKFAVIK